MTKQIKIEELIPFMKKGWVACDKDGYWSYFRQKPVLGFDMWYPQRKFGQEWNTIVLGLYFNIKPAKDWTKSLIKVGGK